MWFGQKAYRIDGRRVMGRWMAYDTKAEALEDKCHFVSILELDLTVTEYESWRRMHEKAGNDPGRQRLTVPFRGPFFADFDRANQVGRLKSALVDALDQIVHTYRLDPDALQLWFSGAKGFHLVLPSVTFGALGYCHPRLPAMYKSFGEALGLGSLMDRGVYSESRGRLWRVANVQRENSLHKIPLTLDELADWDMRKIKRLAKSPRTLPPPPRRALRKNRKLAKVFATCRKAVLEGTDKRMTQQSRVEPSPNQAGADGFDPLELDAIVEALNSLPTDAADNYGDWLRVGMALYHGSHGADDGLQLWSAWSRQSEKYDPLVIEQKWDSFATDRADRITLATLFFMADQDWKSKL